MGLVSVRSFPWGSVFEGGSVGTAPSAYGILDFLVGVAPRNPLKESVP